MHKKLDTELDDLPNFEEDFEMDEGGNGKKDGENQDGENNENKNDKNESKVSVSEDEKNGTLCLNEKKLIGVQAPDGSSFLGYMSGRGCFGEDFGV